MKEITITIPDNCELKQDGNIYTIVEKEKKVTYNDIAKELFENKEVFYTNSAGGIIRAENLYLSYVEQPNNCTSRKQAEKILAINKLMNVAKYLNGDWQPDWNNENEYKYSIYYSHRYNRLSINNVYGIQSQSIYFKTKELAKKAIEILGEETIRLALCTDY